MVEQNVKVVVWKLNVRLIKVPQFQADMIELPADGLIFFGDEKVMLGEAGRWQCNKRKSSEGENFRRYFNIPLLPILELLSQQRRIFV